MPEENSLSHYGVKGMKWGKRKSGSSSTTPAAPNSEDHDRARAVAKKPVNSLSNSEIQTLNRRLQLEKSYKDLKKTPTKFEKGHAQVKTILGVAATASSVYAFANSPLGRGIRTAVNSAAGTTRTTADAVKAARAAKTAVSVGTELVLRR